MSNPWDGLPSIWDGWRSQCFFLLSEAHLSQLLQLETVSHCAIGWLIESGVLVNGRDDAVRAVWTTCSIESYARIRRVNDHIYRKHMQGGPPVVMQCWTWSPDELKDHAIAFANNFLKWTPEQFRELDRRLEYEYQQSIAAPRAEQPSRITVAEDSFVEDPELVGV